MTTPAVYSHFMNMESQVICSTLPAELMVEVLENLNYRDLLKCRLVSRWLRDIIDRFDSFQYKISLASAGVSDNPLNTMLKGQKRELLLQHRAKWLSRQAVPKSANTDKRAYPAQEGPAWELVGGVLAQSRDRNTIEFVRLPSILRGIQEETWTVDLPCPHADFTMDPAQDLLVMIEQWDHGQTRTHLHLLTMSTGKPHPRARSSILFIEYSSDVRPRYEIRINGAYIGLLVEVWSESANVHVWDWGSGETQCYIGSEEHRRIASFIFLDNARILLALESDRGPPISIPPRKGPRLEIVGFKHNAARRWVLLFPRLKAGEDLDQLILTCEPGPLYIPPLDEKPPFHVFDVAKKGRSGERVVMFNMSATQSSAIVTVSLLSTKLLNIPLAFAQAKDGISWVEWQQWGPSTVHLDTMSIWEGLWPCVTYGTKAVLLRPNGARNADIVVQDFSQAGTRWEELRQVQEARESLGISENKPALKVFNGHTEDSVLSLSQRMIRALFEEDVETLLPYTQLEIPGRVSQRDQVMLSEDSIVVVKNGRWNAVSFDVYPI
ncbi:hypothetical protein BDY19DRAFT_959609 [Irpex rosettiformis]|uniref:Uncharacterized protein n=1 Tax=Irpex rosettiformis TaxID=378272 RepID=A0ACB8TXF1_9APHY|nr:hypothetical protein BDY19DRAFT_959609 [Irpex rosettiformis]